MGKINEEEDIEDVVIEDTNEGAEDETSNKGTGNKGTKGTAEKTFTQAQVTKMMTREKSQGRNSAYKEIGIDPSDSKMVNMFKAFIESQKTDDQKSAEETAAKDRELAEAKQKILVAEAKAEAMQLGLRTQFVDDAVTLAISKMTDDADLKTLIGELKTKYPVWFDKAADNEDDDGAKAKEDKKAKAGQKGTGSSIKTNKTKSSTEEKGLGARLAAQRKTSNTKTSYWGNK